MCVWMNSRHGVCYNMFGYEKVPRLSVAQNIKFVVTMNQTIHKLHMQRNIVSKVFVVLMSFAVEQELKTVFLAYVLDRCSRSTVCNSNSAQKSSY